MFKLIVVGTMVATTGIVVSALKRYTSIDSHKMVLDKIENDNVKHYVEKYFEANDVVVLEAENAGIKINEKVRKVMNKD